MEYGDWNNVKSLRFAWNAAGRSLSANMEFFGVKQKVLDIRTLRFWRSQDAFIRTRNGLFHNAGKAFRADGRGSTGTQDGLFRNRRRRWEVSENEKTRLRKGGNGETVM